MLDYDLAELYEVPTKALNQAVKRNIKRFPDDFMFRLSVDEWNLMRSQIVTASQTKRNTGVTPFAFTEQVVAMLSGIYDAIENLLDEKAEQKTWENRKRIGFKQ